MNKLILIITVLSLAATVFADTQIKINERKVVLDDSFFESARKQYQTDSYPNSLSRFPKELQKSILDLIGLNNYMNDVVCDNFQIKEVIIVQKSDEIEFNTKSIKKGFLNENWIFDSCGAEMVFQVIASSKGQKLEKVTIVQLNLVDPETNERLKQTLSF